MASSPVGINQENFLEEGPLLWALMNERVLVGVGRESRKGSGQGRHGGVGERPGRAGTAVPSAQLTGGSGRLPVCVKMRGDPSPLPPLLFPHLSLAQCSEHML